MKLSDLFNNSSEKIAKSQDITLNPEWNRDSTPTIHNVIILDRSGSMSSVRSETVGALNEVLGTIRANAADNPEVRQLVTLLTFCSCSQTYIYRNTPVESIGMLREEDYRPCCGTPLYDAIGVLCSQTETFVKNRPADSVSITIITDGYENSSREYTFSMLTKIISRLKDAGWLFAYIGADHDVEAVAVSLHIENNIRFDKSGQGLKNMAENDRAARTAWVNEVCQSIGCCCEPTGEFNEEAFVEAKKANNSKYFKR